MNGILSGNSEAVEQVMSNPKSGRSEQVVSGNSTPWSSRIILPREHGAWGIVSLPFIAAMVVAGEWLSLRTFAAALTVIALFLLRAPVLILLRHRSGHDTNAGRMQTSSNKTELDRVRSQEAANARWSAAIYSLVALIAGGYLLTVLPHFPLLLLGSGAALLAVVTMYFTLKNRQRNPFLQVVGTIGLTASSLPAYLAASGKLDELAFWVWALFAAHSIASVLLVHARLEWIVASRKPESARGPLPHRRDALLAQTGIVVLLFTLVVVGKPLLALPFLPALLLHGLEFCRMASKNLQKVSLQRIGYMQLGGSIAFCFILIAVIA